MQSEQVPQGLIALSLQFVQQVFFRNQKRGEIINSTIPIAKLEDKDLKFPLTDLVMGLLAAGTGGFFSQNPSVLKLKKV